MLRMSVKGSWVKQAAGARRSRAGWAGAQSHAKTCNTHARGQGARWPTRTGACSAPPQRHDACRHAKTCRGEGRSNQARVQATSDGRCVSRQREGQAWTCRLATESGRVQHGSSAEGGTQGRRLVDEAAKKTSRGDWRRAAQSAQCAVEWVGGCRLEKQRRAVAMARQLSLAQLRRERVGEQVVRAVQSVDAGAAGGAA